MSLVTCHYLTPASPEEDNTVSFCPVTQIGQAKKTKQLFRPKSKKRRKRNKEKIIKEGEKFLKMRMSD